MKKYPILCFKPSELDPLKFPKELWDVSDPPEQLFIQGSIHALEKLRDLPDRGLAIVGTREPQIRSINFVNKVIRDLRDAHLIIVSGTVARGIDTAAHTTAIEMGLTTVAILGAGLNVVYPKENEELRNRILDSGGLLISEFPPDLQARGYHFLRRNRIIAGWSRATWVVEAGYRSGALNTARWARDQNRICFTVPCYPQDTAFAGNQTLLDRDHAIAFWGTHSLGVAWLELATHSSKKRLPPKEFLDEKKLKPTHLFYLIEKVQLYTCQQGGIGIQELFDWATFQGWSSECFFTVLQKALHEKAIINRHGTLLSI